MIDKHFVPISRETTGSTRIGDCRKEPLNPFWVLPGGEHGRYAEDAVGRPANQTSEGVMPVIKVTVVIHEER